MSIYVNIYKYIFSFLLKKFYLSSPYFYLSWKEKEHFIFGASDKIL